MSEADKEIVELKRTLASVMQYVDAWVYGDDLLKNEVGRAAVMHDNVMWIMADKDRQIKELDDRFKRVYAIADGLTMGLMEETE